MLFGPGHKLIASDWNYETEFAARREASARATLIRSIHRSMPDEDMGAIAESLPTDQGVWIIAAEIASKALLSALRQHHPERCG